MNKLYRSNSSVAFIGLVIVALYIVYLVAGARILQKSGQSGWKILIPVYGFYCVYKAANSEGVFWGMIAVSIITNIINSIIVASQSNSYYSSYSPTPTIVLTVIAAIIMLILNWTYAKRLAGAFGKGTGFAVGLFFLHPIFFLILAFGDAKHWNG